MRAAGKVIWLVARPETILARMAADATTPARRPALSDQPALEEIIQLLAAREPIYREAADLIVDTEGKPPADVVEEIIAGLQLAAPLVPTLRVGTSDH